MQPTRNFGCHSHAASIRIWRKVKELENYISLKTKRPFQCHADKVALKNLFHTLKTKWIECNRTVSRFYNKNSEWLKGTIQLQYCRPEELEVSEACTSKDNEPSTSSKPRGRPIKDFETLSDRVKRRRSNHLLKTHSTAELAFATSISLRSSGAADAASILKDVTTSSPSHAAKYKTTYRAADLPLCK